MAWSTSGVVDIFPNATVGTGSMAAGDLRIPSGDITSYVAVSNTNPGASELVFGLCETMHSKIQSDAASSPAQDNCQSSSTQTLIGSTLTKTYTFTVKLNFNEASTLASLNVVSENE